MQKHERMAHSQEKNNLTETISKGVKTLEILVKDVKLTVLKYMN